MVFLCLEQLYNQSQRLLAWVEVVLPKTICTKTTVCLLHHSSCSFEASQCVQLRVNLWSKLMILFIKEQNITDLCKDKNFVGAFLTSLILRIPRVVH